MTQAGNFTEQDLVRFFDMLLRLENDLRWTSEPRFHLEVGCIKLAKVGQLRDIEEVILELKSGSASGQGPAPATSKPKPTPPVEPVKSKLQAERATPVVQTPGPADAEKPRTVSPQKPDADPPPDTLSEKPTGTHELPFEARFREKVQQESEKTALYLERVESIHHDGDRLEIKVSAETVRKALESKERKQVLERAAGQLLGKAISVSLIMERVSKAPEERLPTLRFVTPLKAKPWCKASWTCSGVRLPRSRARRILRKNREQTP